MDVRPLHVQPEVVRGGDRGGQLPVLRGRQRRDDVPGDGGEVQPEEERVGTHCFNAYSKVIDYDKVLSPLYRMINLPLSLFATKCML